MQIHSLQSASATQAVGRISQPSAAGKTAELAQTPAAAVDELELSSEAQQISQAQAISRADSSAGDIRTDKVAALREAIASGSYETPERMSAALDKLLDTFA